MPTPSHPSEVPHDNPTVEVLPSSVTDSTPRSSTAARATIAESASKIISIVAIVLAVAVFMIIVGGTWHITQDMSPEHFVNKRFDEILATFQALEENHFVIVIIGGLISLAALVVSIIALIKEHPKMVALIALVMAIMLPSIAIVISTSMINAVAKAMLEGLAI